MGLTSAEVKELTDFIKKCETSSVVLGKSTKNKLAVARLKVGCWICKSQGMPPSLENLASILGPDFKDTIPFINEVKKELGADGPMIHFK